MLFLLRCVLWLSLVYAAILFPHRASTSGQVASMARPGLAEATTSTITKAVGTYCRRRTAECLDDAARLTSLISTAGGAGSPTRAPPAKRPSAADAGRRDPIATILGRNP